MNDLLSPRERLILSAYVRHESIRGAAQELGLAESTVKNAMGHAYAALDENTLIGALKALGWLKVAE